MNTETPRISPILAVKHVRQAAEYYRDVLGFSLDPDNGVFQPSPDEPDGVYAIVKNKEVWIHFQIRRDALPVRDRHVLERDVYLYVDNITATHAELASRGANIISGPSNTPYGVREFTIEDLNGFRLTYGQFL